MSKIKVMDEVLANKIAAGEVVEKTMNVVKELVENSIDAKSTIIKIDLVDSGVKEIKVSDNGIGMDKEDAKIAFSRHATSKLKNIEDLFNIESLGFRGEALPSIAAVSKVELITSNKKEGTKIILDGGKILEISKSDLSDGTTIIVRDLFYNTPVRLKYLKNLYVELSNITDYVTKMALAYPNIKFSLTNNNKELIKTTGDNDLLKVIYNIYGVEVAKKMIDITSENDDYYISGYISYPEITKSNRNSITTFVNGRYIKNNDINKIIIDSYHTYVHENRYPIIVLNIDVDPILVDINIHPTKMNIKFSKFDTLKELITDAIKEKLESLLLIPDANTNIKKETLKEIKKDNFIDEKENKEEVNYEEIKFDFNVCENENNNESEDNYRIKKMEPKAVIYLTYIVAENEDGMYLIDQHAAAERINYEKILDEINNKSYNKISLLTPIKIELVKSEAIILRENIDIINDIGIELEEFGSNTFIIRAHPSWLVEGKEEERIRRIIDIVVEKHIFDRNKFLDKMVASIACHMSVKAHDYISREEQIWILDNFRKCKNPFTCPHGRPTIVSFTKEELEKMFKRDYQE